MREFVDSIAGHNDHAAVASSLNAWFAEARRARWQNSSDVKARYATASIVAGDRIVFNIKGNDYRLIVAVDHQRQIIWIKWIGRHRDYDDISAKEVAYER